MARTKATLAGGARLADHLAVGYLLMNCPLERVREVLAAHGAQSQRHRRISHEVLVYFVMAMCLYGRVAYEEVLRLVIEGLRPCWGDEGLAEHTVTKGAISCGREAIGVGPLKQLYDEQVAPLGPAGMAGVWYRGLRLMALDGSTLEMPDEAGNAERYGYPGSSRGAAAFPHLRFVSLVECGTHVLPGARPGPYAADEKALARTVLPHVDASMLLLADRNFFSFDFWRQAQPTGAKLLFRLKRNQRLPRERNLPDGSYLSTLYRNQSDRRRGKNGIVGRVIEYTLDGIPDPEPSYRLLTNWLDPAAAPAAELAALYHRRWTIEQTLGELKVQLADRPVVLRSKTPDLVEQEFYALLLAHAAIRRLMVQAAANTQQAAEDLSFIHAVRVLKRRLPVLAAFPPSAASTLPAPPARRNRCRPGRHFPRQAQSAGRQT